MRFLHLIAVAAVPLIVSACIGIEIETMKTAPSETLFPEPNGAMSGENYVLDIGERKRGTTKDFELFWGAPLDRRVSKSEETWVWKESGQWCGASIMLVIIPIPLMLPVCTKEQQITFKQGVADSGVSTAKDWGGFMCGLFGTRFNNGGGPSCRSPP